MVLSTMWLAAFTLPFTLGSAGGGVWWAKVELGGWRPLRGVLLTHWPSLLLIAPLCILFYGFLLLLLECLKSVQQISPTRSRGNKYSAYFFAFPVATSFAHFSVKKEGNEGMGGRTGAICRGLRAVHPRPHASPASEGAAAAAAGSPLITPPSPPPPPLSTPPHPITPSPHPHFPTRALMLGKKKAPPEERGCVFCSWTSFEMKPSL